MTWTCSTFLLSRRACSLRRRHPGLSQQQRLSARRYHSNHIRGQSLDPRPTRNYRGGLIWLHQQRFKEQRIHRWSALKTSKTSTALLAACRAVMTIYTQPLASSTRATATSSTARSSKTKESSSKSKIKRRVANRKYLNLMHVNASEPKTRT